MSSFDGCMQKNKNDSDRIIGKGNAVCGQQLVRFGKKTVDVPFKINTRSQEQKKELVKRADFNRY